MHFSLIRGLSVRLLPSGRSFAIFGKERRKGTRFPQTNHWTSNLGIPYVQAFPEAPLQPLCNYLTMG